MKKISKSLVSALMCVTMVLSMTVLPARAAPRMQEWTYKIGVHINDSKNAPSKKGAIKFNVYSKDGTKLGTADVSDVTKRNSTATATLTLSSAPWSVGKFGLQNVSTDGFKIDYYTVQCKRKESSDDKYFGVILPYMPSGNKAGWINASKKEAEISEAFKSCIAVRDYIELGNFEDLADTIYLDDDSKGSVTYKYNGMITDRWYVEEDGKPYNVMNCSDAPVLDYKAVCKLGNGSVVGLDALKANGITEIIESTASGDKVVGLTVDKQRVNAYLKKNNATYAAVVCGYRFTRGGKEMSPVAYSTLKLTRRTFSIKDEGLSNTGKESKIGGGYYYNKASRYILASYMVKTGGSNNNLSVFKIRDTEVKFDSVQLKIGKTSKVINAESTTAKIDYYGRFNVKFNLNEELDSEDVGVTVVLKNGRLKPIGENNVEFMLYDEENGKQTLGDYEHFYSSRKVDNITPKVTFTADDGKIDDWHKELVLNSTADENIHYSDKQNVYRYRLYDKNGNPIQGNDQFAPAAKGMNTKITLKLNTADEGVYSLKIEGEDAAKNSVTQVVENIKLDNKAPEVKVNTSDRKRLSDGTMNISVPFTLSDASGTGKLYYCFVDGDYDAPEFDKNSEMNKTSGTFDSLFGKWAYIDQDPSKDVTEATAMIKIADGKKFTGRVYWFAEDKFGNQTNRKYILVEADNENTTASIDVSGIVDMPLKEYDISISTSDANKVYYRWQYPNGKYISGEKLYTKGDKEIGSGVQKTDSGSEVLMNGEYTLICRVVAPSGRSEAVSQRFVFDNAAPEINVRVNNGTALRKMQEFTVKAIDKSEIVSAYGKFVNPDGSDIAVKEEFEIPITNGTVNHTAVLSDVENGAYALRVRAVDINGYESEIISDFAYVAANAAEMTTEIIADKEYNSLPLTSGDCTLKINAKMPFENSESLTSSMFMYYRLIDGSGAYSAWTKCDNCVIKDNMVTAEYELKNPFVFNDGINEIKVQAALLPGTMSPDNADESYLVTSAAKLYSDRTAPQYRLVYDSVHTNESIKGTLYLSDNVDSELDAAASDPNVILTRSETEENAFDITVKENTDSIITVTDLAGNSAEAFITVTEIDRTAPTAKIIKVGTEAVGDSEKGGLNGTAEIMVKDVDAASIKFAVIPSAALETAADKDGKIKDEYFDSDVSLGIESTEQMRADEEEPNYDGEADILCKLTLSAVTGEYYIGLRSADSLGNEGDIIFDKPINTKRAPIELMSYTVTPKEAGARAMLTAKFNIPVYALPQKLITDTADDEFTVDETNYNIARQQTAVYSQTVTIPIDKLGKYKFYTIDSFSNAMVDENGNEIPCEINITESDVKLNVKNGINVKLLMRTYDDESGSVTDKDVTDEEWVSPMSNFGELLLEAEPVDDDVLLTPADNIDYGFELNEEESEKYFVREQNGYTKLIYTVFSIFIDNEEAEVTGNFGEADIYERIFNAKLFTIGSPDAVWEECAVIDNIDNTPPQTNEKYSTTLPTIGNVTAEVEIYDHQSGIDYIEVDFNDGFVRIDLNDENGNPIDYMEKPYTYEHSHYKIELYSDTDSKSIKRMFIDFGDNGEMRVTPVSKTGCYGGMKEIPIRVININKTPITDNDVKIDYLYQDSSGAWQSVDENSYYKNAKAVISFIDQDEYESRGLRVVNNGGEKERLLDSYQNSFTFEIKDKYGYTYSAEAMLSNFDNIPGTITYKTDSTEAKSNKPVTVYFEVYDNESGIGELKLTGPDGNVVLDKVDEYHYKATLTKGGIYTAVLLDKVGNKTELSLTAPNIDTSELKIARVDYNIEKGKKTSGIVMASIVYNKPNVTLTYVEPTGDIKDGDFNVDYRNSTITFTKNGNVNVYFKDDYGNEAVDVVSNDRSYSVPPSVSAVAVLSEDERTVDVTFEKATENDVPIDLERELNELTVSYGGKTQKIHSYDEDGNLIVAKYSFYQNGVYTFKIHDEEGTAAYVTIRISDIDTAAPIIEQITWTYKYYIDENGVWTEKDGIGEIIPGDEVGYIAASDKYNVTNDDVTVKIVTDKPTKLMDSDGEYNRENEKVFNTNGLFMFNMIKPNGLTASYGLDIEFIDKTPPVIELDADEMIFYENENIGTKYSKALLSEPNKAFKAYDMFGGKTDLSDSVTIDYGKFNPDNLSANTFDRNIEYAIKYTVRDKAGNVTEATRTIRLVGYNDAVVLVDGKLPDYAGRIELDSGMFELELMNFSGTSYAKLAEGVKTMGQMKTAAGTYLTETADGSGKYRAEVKNEGWYTALVQTDKRDYFTIQIYIRRV